MERARLSPLPFLEGTQRSSRINFSCVIKARGWFLVAPEVGTAPFLPAVSSAGSHKVGLLPTLPPVLISDLPALKPPVCALREAGLLLCPQRLQDTRCGGEGAVGAGFLRHVGVIKQQKRKKK